MRETQKNAIFPIKVTLPHDWNGHLQMRGCITIDGQIDNETLIVTHAQKQPAAFWSIYAQNNDGHYEWLADFDSWTETIDCMNFLIKLRELIKHRHLI